MNLTIMTMNFPHTRSRALRATVCAGALWLLAACGGGGGDSLGNGTVVPRFEAASVDGVAGIKDRETGVVWAAQPGGSAGVAPTAQELLIIADLSEAVLSSTFNVVRNKLVQAAEPVVGAVGSAWVVDFGAQRSGRLSDAPLDPTAPFTQWRVLSRPTIGSGGFYDYDNGMASKGGLLWSTCSLGADYLKGTCVGTSKFFSLAQAKAEARSSRLGGYSDWRLPTKAELQALLSLGNSQKSLLPAPFATKDSLDTTLPLQYWTSSSSTATTPNNAWIVDFAVAGDLGGVELVFTSDSDMRLVRLVRP